MNEATATILTNTEILAIDQDELGEQAKPVYKMGGIRVYQKHLKNGSMAVAVLNTSKSEKKFEIMKAPQSNENGRQSLKELLQETPTSLDWR